MTEHTRGTIEGREPSRQVSPRSVDLKIRPFWSPTNTHTTVPDGASICAALGSVIGVRATVGAGVAVGAFVGGGLAPPTVALDVWLALGAAGAAEQAASRRPNTTPATQ